ncbi:hypothetical protein BH24CHL7_BH24CHL7_00990 [soil metagenome]
MGTGIVLMTRKQMIGIKERVEGTHQSPPAAPAVSEAELETEIEATPVA